MAKYRDYPYRRYMNEYAADKIRSMHSLIKQYPNREDVYTRKIDAVKKAVWMYEHGYIITDEAMKIIAEA